MDDVRKAIILRIKSRYNYSSSREAVSHYLQKVYPHPDTMDAEDKMYYAKMHSSLENLLEGLVNDKKDFLRNILKEFS